VGEGAAGVGAAVAGDGVPVALDVDPGVGAVRAGDAAGERVVLDEAAGGAFLEVEVFGGDGGERVADRLVAVAAVLAGAAVLAVLGPVALCRAEVGALAEAGGGLAGVVDERVSQD